MFQRISDITAGGADLFKAEGELLIERARRLLSWSALLGVGMLVLVLGVVTLVVAGAAALSLIIGWIASVAVVGGVGLVAGLVLAMVARWRLKASQEREALPERERARSREARALITGDLPAESLDASTHMRRHRNASRPTGGQASGLKDRVAEFAVKNPGMSIAGVSAVVALLGPTKAVKFVARGMMFAGLASKVMKHVGEHDSSNSSRTNGAAHPGAPGYTPPGATASGVPGTQPPRAPRPAHPQPSDLEPAGAGAQQRRS